MTFDQLNFGTVQEERTFDGDSLDNVKCATTWNMLRKMGQQLSLLLLFSSFRATATIEARGYSGRMMKRPSFAGR